MDLFPDLGEPGILDELFYFGPLVLLIILVAVFFRFSSRWMKGSPWYNRGLVSLLLALISGFVLLAGCMVAMRILID